VDRRKVVVEAMVLDSILSSSPRLKSPSFRRPKDGLGSWSTLYQRHCFLLSALVLLTILCTVYLYFATKATFVGPGFTRKPPKYERFIRPTGLTFTKAHVTHPKIKCTFNLEIIGV
jgi:hypothetical protein